MREPVPAVMPVSQATLLTGTFPNQHGIVASGWLFKETREIRFWQQSNYLLQAPPVYAIAREFARRQNRPFRVAKLFWWFNQGADVDLSVTPKPYYGADGDKRFAISTTPSHLCGELEGELGPFPFLSFWGPKAGLESSRWIANAASHILKKQRPDLLLAYIPHLDYDLQRYSPDGPEAAQAVRDLDMTLGPILAAATELGATLMIVNEYSHRPVEHVIYPNRLLREAGLLQVRAGPFGETLETFESSAFAVCDHQVAHVYYHPRVDNDLRERVKELFQARPGIATVLTRSELASENLAHERSGDLVLLAEPNAWFAYPYWLNDRHAPDFARCVDIHRKPGFDPCELYFDPKLMWPTARMAMRLAQKRLGLRTLFDVVPLDASLVRGSHGLRAEDPSCRPLLLGTGSRPATDHQGSICMTQVRDLVLRALNLTEPAP